MGFHTYAPDRADRVEDESQYRRCSGEELLTLLAPHRKTTVADLGSGTGFYTDVVAPLADKVYAVDVQPAMHDLYAERGSPRTSPPSPRRSPTCRSRTTRWTRRSRR